MFTEEYAKSIAMKIEKEKIFLKSNNTDYLLKFEIETYFYATEEDRKNHIDKMKKLGWFFDKSQNEKEFLHTDLYERTEDVMVYTAYFKKQIKG